MRFKSALIAVALLSSAPAFAQQATPHEGPNFILGHGVLPPAQPPGDYPPGHAMTRTQGAPVTANSRSDTVKPADRTAPSGK
jgi:hypothetical protein